MPSFIFNKKKTSDLCTLMCTLMFVQTNGDNKGGTQKLISPDNVLVYITPSQT